MLYWLQEGLWLCQNMEHIKAITCARTPDYSSGEPLQWTRNYCQNRIWRNRIEKGWDKDAYCSHIFLIYCEFITTMTGLEKTTTGTKVGGWNNNGLGFASNVTVLCKEELVENEKMGSENCVLMLNINKMKVMSTSMLS